MESNNPYYRQVRFLIQLLPLVGEESCFALKGGTAINLFVRDLPRLSVDIDLVYLPTHDRAQALEAIKAALKQIAQRIKSVFPSAHITETFLDKSDALRLIVAHKGVQIKIELSPVLRGTVYEPEIRSVTASVEEQFGFAEIAVVSLADLYAGKLCAALDRQHPRDLYDVKLLLENEGNLISLGMFYGFMSYKSNFIGSMDRLVNQWIAFKMLGLYMNRLADIAFTPPEDIDQHLLASEDMQGSAESAQASNEKNKSMDMDVLNVHKDIVGKIEVKNLAYKYGESEDPIFENLNFIILPGETVAITGPSGCGKTTLLKCLMGLIEPTGGEILIDNKPLKDLPQYRSKIASVMQEDQLLSGDISENISCFAPKIDFKKVNECAKMACIRDEIQKLPMGFNTFVGDMGSSLSGGQKQRIVLARALYREPRILFMDEATSHLDVANESLVNENIQHLDITRIIVAHRPETISSASREINLTDFCVRD